MANTGLIIFLVIFIILVIVGAIILGAIILRRNKDKDDPITPTPTPTPIGPTGPDAPVAPGGFFGPWNRGFTDAQCPTIRSPGDQVNLTACATRCLANENCTAIDYNPSIGCVLMACPTGAVPTSSFPGNASYTKYDIPSFR